MSQMSTSCRRRRCRRQTWDTRRANHRLLFRQVPKCRSGLWANLSDGFCFVYRICSLIFASWGFVGNSEASRVHGILAFFLEIRVANSLFILLFSAFTLLSLRLCGELVFLTVFVSLLSIA